MSKLSEKEKMLAGIAYLASDEELVKDRERAKKLCKKFNSLEPDNYEEREAVLKELLKTEESCYIEPNFFCDYGYNIEIGKNFYAIQLYYIRRIRLRLATSVCANVQVYTATSH